MILIFSILQSTKFAQAQNETSAIYPTGAILSPEKAVNKIPKTKIYRDFHPKRIDLTKYSPKPGRQVNSSCVGWAVAYAARTFHFAWDNGESPDQKDNIASPSALYNSIVQPPVHRKDPCDTGTRITDALKWIKTSGVPSSAIFPSNSKGSCNRKVPSSLAEVSKRFTIKDYRLVPFNSNLTNGIGISRIRDQLAQKRPVIVGANIPKSFYTPRKGHVYTDTYTPKKRRGHAITLIGYDDEKGPGPGAFKIQNSWGTDWGDGGYLWISYTSLVALADNAFVLETRPIKARKKKPKPQPVIVDDISSVIDKAVRVLSSFDCAGVDKKKSDETKVIFFTRSQEDHMAISEQLSKSIPTIPIEGKITPWPQCEALLTFQNQLHTNRGLRLAIKGHEDSIQPMLTEGDPFVMRIKTPDFPSYLYATYLQTDEQLKHEAIHLIQSVDILKQYPPNTELTIGDGLNNSD